MGVMCLHIKQLEVKPMKHFTLKNGTVLKSEKQTAEVFKTLHKEAYHINADVKSCKTIMLTNNVFNWFANGIDITIGEKYSSFSQSDAIEMLKEKGATEKEIKSLYKNKKRNVIKLPKTSY
jgi:tRNA U55 pseudouridine synthase TruB|tara:strand:+ start:102 stop:464 length:363 start_codon:yes stop_codon:yes gene_type:complete